MEVLNGTRGPPSWIELLHDDEAFSAATGTSPWICATACAAMVGLSGLFPMLLISGTVRNDARLRFMLSFACGGLLGDVFLHLLPEAYEQARRTHDDHINLGGWILFGFLIFIVIEKLCSVEEDPDAKGKEDGISVAGYLNLGANCVDNFAHGLAVGGAFLVSHKEGFLTTAAILCHEIPHEIGDFAILIKSGFNRYDAAKAQFTTAMLGMLGALTALFLHSTASIEGVTGWIIPFTCGGFVNIALVSVLPDLLRSDTVADFARVLAGIALGISVMTAVASL